MNSSSSELIESSSSELIESSSSELIESNFDGVFIGVHGAIPVLKEKDLTKSDPTPVVVYPETFHCPYKMCIVLSKAEPLETSDILEIIQEVLRSATPEDVKCLITEVEEYSFIEQAYKSFFKDRSFSNDDKFLQAVSDFKEYLHKIKLDYFMKIYKEGNIMIQKELIYDSEPSYPDINFKNEIIVYSGKNQDILNLLRPETRGSYNERAEGGYNLSDVLNHAYKKTNSRYCLLVDCSCYDWRVVFMSQRQERAARRDLRDIVSQIQENHYAHLASLNPILIEPKRSEPKRSERKRSEPKRSERKRSELKRLKLKLKRSKRRLTIKSLGGKIKRKTMKNKNR